MIYFMLFGLGAVTAIYWFIAGVLFGKMGEDIMAMENEWERSIAVCLGVVFWPLGVLVGLWLKRHPQFEPRTWRDWALIPWWLLRYAHAWVYSKPWYLAWRFHCWLEKYGVRVKWLPGPIGRWDNPDPVMCPRCLWAGMVRWLRHEYVFIYSDDVEPCDYCPRCGEEL